MNSISLVLLKSNRISPNQSTKQVSQMYNLDFRATKSHQLKVFTDDELMKIK